MKHPAEALVRIGLQRPMLLMSLALQGNARAAEPTSFESIHDRPLIQKRQAPSGADHRKAAYGTAPSEAESSKVLQARVDAAHSCAGIDR